MRLFTTVIFISASFFNLSQAQEPILYGTTTSGNGGIFRYNEGNKELTNVYRIRNSGVYRRSHMVEGNDGIIYGVALGGPFGQGIIFSLNPANNEYIIRKNFREIDGATPNSALVKGKDGKLYGTTEGGGHNGNGVLFSFDPANSVFRILLHFNDVYVSSPGALTSASDGLLYGIATGGPDFKQLIYSFDPVGNEFQAQVYIPDEFGFFPSEAMTEVRTGGILYGVMSFGGANEGGTLFSYSLGSKELIKQFDFNSTSGLNPNGTMVLGSDNKLYSTTSSGGANKLGTAFSYDPIGNIVTAIHHFDGSKGGSSRGSLAEGEDGKLYGMTLKAVPKGRNFDFIGSIFYSIDKNGSNYQVLRDFDHPGRSLGEGNIIQVNSKLYGIASAEKTNPFEYIFSYESSRDLFQKIIRTNEDKGYHPTGSMLQARDGRFYGFTSRGGEFNVGGIFSFNPGSQLYSMLMPFNEDRGNSPRGELVQAENGRLYGLTSYGGAGGFGVIFSFNPQTSRYIIEKNFTSGSRPINGFIAGDDGNFYSIVQREVKVGEVWNYEYDIFSFNPGTREYKEVQKLCCGSAGIFTKSSDGKLYASGQTGIYSYDPATNNSELIPYPPESSENSISPSERIVQAADGKFYGLSPFGGAYGRGAIYAFDPLNKSFTTHYSFDEETGFFPAGSLRYASNGKLYGTTREGGMNQLGTLFSFDPLTQSFNLIRHFDVYTGGVPAAGQLVELNTTNPPIVSITDKKMFEGEEAVLTVSLNRISMEDVRLNFQTMPGTANDAGKNADFTPVSGLLVIPAGEISANISVALLEDELIEKRETFTVVLQKADEALYQLGDSIGVINIKNGSAAIIPPGGEIINISPMPGSVTENSVKNQVSIRATPNPSSDFFTLYISGNNTDRVSITVSNLSGQITDKFDGALKNSQLVFGQNYQSGSYFVRVVDGKKSQVIKLIKTSK